MGKIKSAICLVLATLIIAALSFICFVSLPAGDGVSKFDPVVTWIDKDANLGVEFGASGSYYGGGYTATYFPQGVISARAYEDNKNDKTGDEQVEYANRYVQVGGLCFDSEEITVENGKVTDEAFIANFAAAKQRLIDRYKAMNIENIRIETVDEYAVRVFVPQSPETANAYTSLFAIFGYMGDFEVLYGADEASATTVLPARPTESIGQYVDGASSAADATGANFVAIRFTDEGKTRLASKTADIESSGVLIFKIGKDTVISLTIDSAVSDNTIYVSNPSSPFSKEAAQALAVLIDSEAKSTEPIPDGTFSVSYDNVVSTRAIYGDSALMYLYIAFGVCFVLMMVFFFVRYGLLGFVHMYTYLAFLLVTILCMWGISFVSLSTGTFAAVLIASLLLSASQALVYENVHKEYKTGKTIAASVKNGYKKTFWHIFDAHIVVAALSFIVYGIGITQLSAFAFMLGLATVFSGICALGLGRFFWAIMMSFTDKKARFCNFKRVEVEEND